MTQPEILIDVELKLNELSPNFITTLQKFAPFGHENHKPFFTLRIRFGFGKKFKANLVITHHPIDF